MRWETHRCSRGSPQKGEPMKDSIVCLDVLRLFDEGAGAAGADATDAQTSAANDDEDEIDPSDAAVSADA